MSNRIGSSCWFMEFDQSNSRRYNYAEWQSGTLIAWSTHTYCVNSTYVCTKQVAVIEKADGSVVVASTEDITFAANPYERQ